MAVGGSGKAVATGKRLFGVDLVQGTVETLDAEPGSRDAVVMLENIGETLDITPVRRRAPVRKPARKPAAKRRKSG